MRAAKFVEPSLDPNTSSLSLSLSLSLHVYPHIYIPLPIRLPLSLSPSLSLSHSLSILVAHLSNDRALSHTLSLVLTHSLSLSHSLSRMSRMQRQTRKTRATQGASPTHFLMSKVPLYSPRLCRMQNAPKAAILVACFGKSNDSWTCLVHTFGRAGTNLGRDALR